MSMHITPNICVQLTPEFSVLVDGCDVTKAIKAHAGVQLGSFGRLVGWARDAFAFGLDGTGAKPKDGRDPEQLRVRISNLEAQNDNLRVNNAALRDAIVMLSSLVHTVNNAVVHVSPTEPKTPRIPPAPVEVG